MRRAKKAFLGQVFEVLGPDRVACGLEATGHSWNDCFLALATLRPSDSSGGIPTSVLGAGQFFGRIMGVAPGWVYEAVRLWDKDEAGVRAVGREWLEARDKDVSAASTAGVRGCERASGVLTPF